MLTALLVLRLKSQVYEKLQESWRFARGFNEAVTAGEISVDDLNNALIQVSDKGGKAIQTLPDAMDSLKEVLVLNYNHYLIH